MAGAANLSAAAEAARAAGASAALPAAPGSDLRSVSALFVSSSHSFEISQKNLLDSNSVLSAA